jgi:hypothetical protein
MSPRFSLGHGLRTWRQKAVRWVRRAAHPSGRGLTLLGAALLAIPLVVLAAGWAAGAMSIQVWYIVWYADLVLGSVPQEVYWAFLVVISVVVAGLSLIRRRERHSGGSENLRAGPVPVRELAALIQDTEDGYYYQWSLAQELSSLIVEAVEGRRLSPSELRREWYSQEKPGVPADIQAYVKEGIWGSYVAPGNVASRLGRAILGHQPASPLDLDPEVVVKFIEERLEVADGTRRT